MDAIIQRLEAKGPHISARVIAEMYENPFWTERFGERARKHANQDGDYHISYLLQALMARDVAVLVSYARWLQSVLTSRGMCTRHLADNFERLERVIGQEVEDASLATEYLREARAALRYDDGPGRELQDLADGIADAAVDALYQRHPGSLSQPGEAGKRSAHEDIQYHLSYLSDAVALGKPELFVAYTAWLDGFLRRRGMLPEYLPQTLEVIAQQLSRQPALSQEARAAAGDALRQGLQRLADGADTAAAGPGSAAT
jgi:hypothetical protein